MGNRSILFLFVLAIGVAAMLVVGRIYDAQHIEHQLAVDSERQTDEAHQGEYRQSAALANEVVANENEEQSPYNGITLEPVQPSGFH